MIGVVQKIILLVSLFWVTNEKVAIDPISTIEGKVTDVRTTEPILFGTVVLYKNAVLITKTETDLDGNYFFSNVQPGTYDIEASYLGYATQRQTNVIIKAGRTNKVNFGLSEDTALIDLGVEIKAYKVPLIEYDNTTQGNSVTADKIRSLPNKSVNAIAASAAGLSTNKDGSEISIRGSRSNETVYFLDGVRVSGDLIPQSEITAESYAKITENKFNNVEEESLSTFALDVDKASYSNVRRFINDGQLPPVDAVRIEEMINYFPYDYAAPKNNDILGVTTHLTDCPWNSGLKLLHIGVQSKKIDTKDLPLSNLVFLIDVSGSMQNQNKLPLVISSLKILLNQLRPDDRVAIVTYAGSAGVALPSTKAIEKQKIIQVLDNLSAGGSTAGAQGIISAYNIAIENYIPKGNNRVILATDGDFNVGVSDNLSLEKLIEEKKKSGVFLSVLGYGMGNYKDDKMQILADKGNGNHAYIDDINEAIKVLGSEFGGTMYTLAKDVKFQIEFNPEKVAHYRLVGYENRMLAKEEFNDDKKDGGELGMGQQMTAMYEIILANASSNITVDPLKYQNKKKSKSNGYDNEIATIKFRYKDPESLVSKKWEQIISDKLSEINGLNDDVRFSIAVAYSGLLLRDGFTLESKTFDKMLLLASESKGEDINGYKTEFLHLIKTASQLKQNQMVISEGD